MSSFYQPYQFVPVKGLSEESKSTLSFADIKLDDHQHFVRHDVWKTANSGKVVCTLTLETPMALGLEHKSTTGTPPNTTAVPQKRLFGERSHYYIPGNSLRGMTSAIAEAITQSNLRVLENTPLKISMGKNKSKPLGKLHDYFESISTDLLPLGSPLRNTPALTPAELIFGCIETQGSNKTDTAIALASRVRFSDAKLTTQFESPLMDEVTLKALNTPKTNSHNMYYHPIGNQGEYIPKSELDSRDHHPNGRKFYLHATQSMIENKAWAIDGKLDKPKLHVKCQPFKENQTFTFHIDFDNLSDAELSVLLTSLRPAENFRHKMGMGKPIGLGTVRVDIQGIFLINRQKRYGRDAFQQDRYERVMIDPNSKSSITDWEDYPLEKKHFDAIQHEEILIKSHLIDNDSFDVLKRIGQWPYTETEEQHEIEYPYTENAKGEKSAGYSWFVKNDKPGGGQTLKAANPQLSLPTLNSYLVEK